MKKSIIIGVLGIALILCAFTGGVVAAGALGGNTLTIDISSNPTGATVYFISDYGDSYYMGKTPISEAYHSGTAPEFGYGTTDYFEISKSGYVTDKSCRITSNDWKKAEEGSHTISYNVNLKSNGGTLDISSSPSGASVKIDGVYYDTTPLSVTVPSGTHTITISKSGYSPYSTSAYVKAGEITYIDASLSSSSGYIAVASNPKGASVYIDGSYVGQTDNTFSASTGTHSITITKAGYGSYGSKVTVNAGSVSTVSANLPESSPKGYVNVASTPAGASVYIDGSYVGVTPSSGYLDAGPYSTSSSHSIQLRLSGYETYTSTFSTSTSSTPVIVATLTPDKSTTGTIHVTSSPVGATVTVDGTYYGTTPVSVPNLNAGSHTVKVSAAGYVDNIQTINVNAGQYIELPVTLYTASPTQQSPAPLLGVLAGLAAAGVFCALRRRE